MRIAVTGCNGFVGTRVVLLALRRGHTVVGIDYSDPSPASLPANSNFHFLRVDLRVYEDALTSIQGCDAIVHLAAYRNPGDYGVTTHNSNVVMSWNILRGAAELGIKRVVQASSVNVLTLVYSKHHHFDYFPLDERHPCLPDEPYGLSKVICEMQADTIVRRYPDIRIASLRLHWSIPEKSVAQSMDAEKSKNDLWGYVQEDSSAEAFLLAIGDSAKYEGHEAFFITAPEIAFDADSKQLREEFWPNVPITAGKDVSGSKGFFDCSKARELLGWVHKDPFVDAVES
ncbi:NAD(P)-binding protein [Hymenopellis radicata]|nr:NAD(P)-binding protein [Hymenopellis radicata]